MSVCHSSQTDILTNTVWILKENYLIKEEMTSNWGDHKKIILFYIFPVTLREEKLIYWSLVAISVVNC